MFTSYVVITYNLSPPDAFMHLLTETSLLIASLINPTRSSYELHTDNQTEFNRNLTKRKVAMEKEERHCSGPCGIMYTLAVQLRLIGCL